MKLEAHLMVPLAHVNAGVAEGWLPMWSSKKAAQRMRRHMRWLKDQKEKREAKAKAQALVERAQQEAERKAQRAQHGGILKRAADRVKRFFSRRTS